MSDFQKSLVSASKFRVMWVRRVAMVATFVGLAVSATGCALLKSPPPPRDTFEISAPQSFGGLASSTRAQILVKQPTALKSIDSNRMVLRTGASEITYLAGAQWSDTVPRMVQAKLVEAFENTSAVGAVAKPGDGLVIDYQLVIDIRRFEITGDASPEAVIEMSVKLLTDRSGKVIETGIFRAAAPVAADGTAGAVSAFDAAFDKLSRGVVRWVLSRV